MFLTQSLSAQSLPATGQKPLRDELAPESEAADKELIQNSEYPISNLTKLPIQSNFQFNTGRSDAAVTVFKLQPVIPFALNREWSLVSRTTVPIVNQPSLAPGSPSVFGLGDLQPAFYFSRSQSTKSLFGFGPIFTFPTGTTSQLTAGKWSAGPAVAARITVEDVVAGFLISNQWSYAGWGNKDVNALSLQYVLSYNLPGGWFLTSSPTMTSNWESRSGNRWTVPVGGGFGKLFRIENQPMQFSMQAFDNVLHPTGSSDWSFRVQIQFLFPK